MYGASRVDAIYHDNNSNNSQTDTSTIDYHNTSIIYNTMMDSGTSKKRFQKVSSELQRQHKRYLPQETSGHKKQSTSNQS